MLNMRRIIFTIFISTILFPSVSFAVDMQSSFLQHIGRTGLKKSVQSACVEDQNGKVTSFNENMLIVPASVSKVYVFDMALSKLSPDFRYTTTFYRVGDILYINGGGDPHFIDDHLADVINKMTKSRDKPFKTFIFSHDFLFNWRHKSDEVQMALFNSLKKYPNLPVADQIRVIPSSQKYSGKGEKYEFRSAPLISLMKQINNYSTNISADVLFDRLGGSTEFMKYMKDNYGVGSETVYFKGGSGLTGNYTTCALTLRVIKNLESKLKNRKMSLTDILSVPDIDPGVLRDRDIDIGDATSVVAKSGYVNRHHALAGAINTRKGPVYFGIFSTYSTNKQNKATKAMVDKFLNTILDNYRSVLRPYNYTPDEKALGNIIIRKV